MKYSNGGERISRNQLRGICLSVPKGKLIGICGGVGSGKSSLLAAICGDVSTCYLNEVNCLTI